MDTENNIIVDEDDSSEDSAETTVADRIFEIRDRVSFEIIAKNIVQLNDILITFLVKYFFHFFFCLLKPITIFISLNWL